MAISKKFLAALFAGSLSLSLLAACSSEEDSSESQESSATTTTETSAEQSSAATENVLNEDHVYPVRDYLAEDLEDPEEHYAILDLARAHDLNGYAYNVAGIRALLPNLSDPEGFESDELFSESTGALTWLAMGEAMDNFSTIAITAFEFPGGVTEEELREAVEAEYLDAGAEAAEIESLDGYPGFKAAFVDEEPGFYSEIGGYYWLGNGGTTVYQLVIFLNDQALAAGLDDWAYGIIAESA